jgi:hypothetical protein
MKNNNIKIDFSKEPYKSMVDQEDQEYSKRMITFLVNKVGEPDEKGNFRISVEDAEKFQKEVFNNILSHRKTNFN